MKGFLWIVMIVVSPVVMAQNLQPWQKINNPTTSEVKALFATPPAEHGLVLWWGWDGPVDEEVIRRDLDTIQSKGFTQVMIEAGYGMSEPYLSPGWFRLVKYAVEQAAKRGMKVWAEDEGKYPSGFAGGKFSAERPDLRMQALIVDERIDLKEGETISRKLSDGVISAVAVNAEGQSIIIKIKAGKINWKAPKGEWLVILARHDFRTSVTRSVNNPTRGKDASASLFDYMNPAGTRQFIDWTHAQYKNALGDEFGKTFMGLMGDEPDFAFTPWTPAIIKEFQKRKGYDVTSFLASFFIRQPSEDARRAKADYWDVWSDLFRDNFFKVQADYCAANGGEYIVHLNHEEKLPELTRSEGDYFKAMRYVGIPGVDAIWSQIWMDHEADYPKLASSAAHLFGRPRAFTESFAAYSYKPTVEQAKWVIDYQLVRGINLVQIMFMGSSARPKSPTPADVKIHKSFFLQPEFKEVASYVNRANYLLTRGIPAARIAVYMPTSSFWLGDTTANRSLLTISRQLLEAQRDFDFVDEQALSSVLELHDSALYNLSGQGYQTVIVPSVKVLSEQAVKKLAAFVKIGGKVIFLGEKPQLIVSKSFLKAKPAGIYPWATYEPSGDIKTVLAQLPSPDVTFSTSAPPVKYLHRKWRDADLYFFFNESDKPQNVTVSQEGEGHIREWNAVSGKITDLETSGSNNFWVTFPLNLTGYGTKFVVVEQK